MAEFLMWQEMQRYLKDNGGRWKWGKCDCAGLLLHLCSKVRGVKYHRDDYIRSDWSYEDALIYLSTIRDPLQPYKELLERDAGFERIDIGEWDVKVFMTRDPLTLRDNRTIYPTHTAPGVLFYPGDMEPCVLHRKGFSPVEPAARSITKSVKYRLYGPAE